MNSTTEKSDEFASHLQPEINSSRIEIENIQKAIQYKQAGLDFIGACKYASTNENGEIDINILKEKLLSAITFVQTYHDNL